MTATKPKAAEGSPEPLTALQRLLCPECSARIYEEIAKDLGEERAELVLGVRPK